MTTVRVSAPIVARVVGPNHEVRMVSSGAVARVHAGPVVTVGSVDQAQIDQSVEDYLEANPPSGLPQPIGDEGEAVFSDGTEGVWRPITVGDIAGFPPVRATVHAPSDGPSGVGTGGTIVDVDPNDTAIVICDVAEVSGERAQIRVPEPSTWVGESLAILPAASTVNGASVFYEEDQHAYIGELYQSMFLEAYPWNLAGVTIVLNINGTNRTFVGQDFEGDANAFAAALLGAFVGLEFANVVTPFLAGQTYALALRTTATGDGATISVVDAGAGDPLGFGAATTTQGETATRIGWHRTTEGTGNGNTHTWPDAANLPNKAFVLFGAETEMVLVEAYQRNEYTNLSVTEISGPLDDATNNLQGWNIVNQELKDLAAGGGGGGASLSDDDPEELGSSGPGTSPDASRSDHVHPMPTAEDIDAQPHSDRLSELATLNTNTTVPLQVSGAWTAGTMSALKTALSLGKGDVGLGNVDDTSDANKPVSTATQTALDAKIANTLVDAKGDLLTASADNTPARLAAGSSGQVPMVDASASVGLAYGFAPGISIARPYVAGKYYAVPRAVAGTASFGADFIRYVPYVPHARVTMDRLIIYTNITSGGAARLGIYDSTGMNSYPGALILDAGAVATTGATGERSITISQSLQPGRLYWLAVNFNVTTTAAHTSRSTYSEPQWGEESAITGPLFFATESFAYAAMPTTATPTASGANTPSIWLRSA